MLNILGMLFWLAVPALFIGLLCAYPLLKLRAKRPFLWDWALPFAPAYLWLLLLACRIASNKLGNLIELEITILLSIVIFWIYTFVIADRRQRNFSLLFFFGTLAMPIFFRLLMPELEI
jgi:hypothetical protein